MINKHFVISIVSLLLVSACGTTKNTVDFTNVMKGEQLDKANEITVEQFMNIWINNQYPVKIDINCHELYSDENFTYFGKNGYKLFSQEPLFFKVNSDSLTLKFKNFTEVDGQIIRQEFWEQIVPKSDIEIQKNTECRSSSSIPSYTYELIEHKIKIRLHWIFKCNGRKIFEKDYNGYYDLKALKIKA